MSSVNGIININIKKFFDDETNNILKRNFIGVYSSDSITKFVNSNNIIKKRANYPLTIFNNHRENKPGTHWWIFLDIYPEKDLLSFDNF